MKHILFSGKKLLLAVAVPAVVFVFVPASATTIKAIYNGTVTSGTDQIGIFGGGDLTGDSFVVSFSFDLDLASYLTPTDAYGGVAYGGSPLFSSAVVTVNGMSYTIAPCYTGSILGENNGPGAESEQNHYVANGSFLAAYTQEYIQNFNGDLPASIAQGFSYTVQPSDTTYGAVTIWNPSYQYAALSARLDNLTVSTPEASTWVMTLLSFAGLGFVRYKASCKSSAATV